MQASSVPAFFHALNVQIEHLVYNQVFKGIFRENSPIGEDRGLVALMRYRKVYTFL